MISSNYEGRRFYYHIIIQINQLHRHVIHEP